MFEDQAIGSFEFKHPTSKGDKDIEYASLMQYLAICMCRRNPEPESPKAIAGGLCGIGHCYNDSILLATLLQKEGYFASTGKDLLKFQAQEVEVMTSADETGQLLSTYEVRMFNGSIQVRHIPIPSQNKRVGILLHESHADLHF